MSRAPRVAKLLSQAVQHQRGGRLAQAAAAYEAVLACRPQCVDALRGLARLGREAGADGRVEASLRRAVEHCPDHAGLHGSYAYALYRWGRLEAAEGFLRRALRRMPGEATLHLQLGIVLRARRRHVEAVAAYRQAVRLAPDSFDARFNLGNALSEVGAVEEAERAYRGALQLRPDATQARNNMGNLLQSVGRLEEAAEQYRQALQCDPTFTEAARNLAATRRFRSVEDADARRIAALFDQPALSARQTMPLHFALGKIYDDCGDYAQAFRHYQEANRLRRAQVRFDCRHYRQGVQRICTAFAGPLAKGSTPANRHAGYPVFIVGMPRSGTTLVEQMLAAHPAVVAGGERTTLFELVDRIGALSGVRRPYPEGVAQLGSSHLARLRTDYLRPFAMALTCDGKRVVTDKNPLNFRHLGLISLLLPEARIIHCVRDPRDTCLSIYFQCFVHGHPYAYDLEEIACFYEGYRCMLRHWRQTLSLPMLDVHYEELIRRPEVVARAILGFLDLAWDPRCLRFCAAPRAVRTASAWQVRQPLYGRSVGRWRHYERWLGPLLQHLRATAAVE